MQLRFIFILFWAPLWSFVLLFSTICSFQTLFYRYRGFILFLTFLFYTAYHLSRKPISIVKVTENNSICSFYRVFAGTWEVSVMHHQQPCGAPQYVFGNHEKGIIIFISCCHVALFWLITTDSFSLGNG